MLLKDATAADIADLNERLRQRRIDKNAERQMDQVVRMVQKRKHPENNVSPEQGCTVRQKSVISNTTSKKASGVKKRKYLKRKKVNWYWDVRIWTPLYVILLAMILIFIPKIGTKENVEPIAFIEYDVEPTHQEVEEIKGDDEIVMLARLAESVASGRSNEVKKIVMWVAINRSEDRSNGYGRSLEEEISRPKQWQQYDPDAAYLESTYELAKDVYNTWITGGARPIYKDMLWFVLNGDGSITVRNQFKDGKNRAEVTIGQ